MIIVTGGAGFIGSNIVRALNEAGEDKIIIVDRLGKADKWNNLADVHFLDYEHKDKFLTQLDQGIFDGLVTNFPYVVAYHHYIQE